MTDSRPDPESPIPPGITVSQRFSISLPQGATAYPIAVATWERLKRDILRITPAKHLYESAGWVCAGVAITTFLAMFMPSAVSAYTKVISWAVIFCFGVLAIALLALDSQQRENVSKSAKIVVDEMCETEKMFTEARDVGRPTGKSAEF
jgi:hypothetical protein